MLSALHRHFRVLLLHSNTYFLEFVGRHTLLISSICESYCESHLFSPIISAACFKISFSIASLWFSLRSFNNSSCSGVQLSFSSNDPEALCWRTHLSKADGVSSYSLIISPLL